MNNTKKYIPHIIAISIILITAILFGVGVRYVREMPHYNFYRLNPEMSKFIVFETPEDFCEKKGEGGIWQDNYTFAFVDPKGYLILILTDEQVQIYKNNLYTLQILQAVLGNTRDIGVQITDETDFFGFIEFAPTCGIKVSEDYKTFTKGPGGNRFYVPLIAEACMQLQFINGVPSEEIGVDYYLYDENGNVKQHISYPEDMNKEITLE